ncbi:MAG TPA: hypothetical protein ENO20_01930 [Bacteroides sp.]|nr:hypothetical protein [Bacteroides sp.]
MKIESRIGKSSSSDQQIYGFLTDFNNFSRIVPQDRVSQWESSTEQCSFRVDPVGKATLKIVEKKPCSLVKIASVPEFSTYNFTIWIQLKRVNEQDTRVKVTIEPHVNRFLLSMIRSQLKQLVDGIVDQIETFHFDQ